MIGSFGGLGGKLPFFLFAATLCLRMMKSKEKKRMRGAREGKEGKTFEFRKSLKNKRKMFTNRKWSFLFPLNRPKRKCYPFQLSFSYII